jgi:hypothetical protein
VTLGELTKTADIRVVSIERNGEKISEPPEDLVLQAGDRLTARASAQAFAAAARLLRSSPGEEETSPVRSIQLTHEQRNACEHAASVRPDVTTAATGCEECLKLGDTWVHLRICMKCAHVGCCDSSKNRHATKHYKSTDHPVIRSFQRGEDWAWCYPDEIAF